MFSIVLSSTPLKITRTIVSLVAILDADKEGFLRSETSLIQTVGRAARNANGQVIMYADEVTGSMERAITETYRRREKQMKFNEENGIVPQTIKKDVREILEISSKDNVQEKMAKKRLSAKEKSEFIERLTKEMRAAAKLLESGIYTADCFDIHEELPEMRKRLQKSATE